MNINSFLDEIEKVINIEEVLSNEAQDFFNQLRKNAKPNFTENGKKILLCMQENTKDYNTFNAKQLGELLFMSPRSVSGSIKKLLTDGYCEKVGITPVTYKITDAGMEIKFD